MSSIIPSLKQFSSEVSWRITIINIYFTKSCKQSFLHCIDHLCKTNPAGASTNLQVVATTEFHPNWYLNLQENGHQSFWFSHNFDLEWRSSSSKLIWKCSSTLVVTIIKPGLNEIGLQMPEYKPMLKLFCFFVVVFFFGGGGVFLIEIA